MMRYSTRFHLEVAGFTIEASMELSIDSPARKCRVDPPIMMEAHVV